MIEILLAAMMMVESGGRCDLVGDGGRSIGPLQIQYAYWKDSGLAGRYQDCRKPAYAKRVVRAYWKRYCPRALKRGDLQTLARVHNGGPSGANPKFVKRYAATGRYWKKVERKLKSK